MGWCFRWRRGGAAGEPQEPGVAARGLVLVVEIVATPPIGWIRGVSNSVSWTVSIRVRPSWGEGSPKRARREASGPGPRTRTREDALEVAPILKNWSARRLEPSRGVAVRRRRASWAWDKPAPSGPSAPSAAHRPAEPAGRRAAPREEERNCRCAAGVGGAAYCGIMGTICGYCGAYWGA